MTRENLQGIGDLAAVTLALILIWAGLSWLIGASALPSPATTAQHLVAALGQGRFLDDLSATA